MARSGMNTEQAKRMVMSARFAGVGLAVAAAALWIMGVPGLSGQMPAKPVVSIAGSGPVEAPAIVQVHIAGDAPLGIAERLDIAANRPAKVVAPVDNGTPRLQETQPEPTPWKYLGPIYEATRTLALVSLEGKQRIVSEGSRVKIKTPSAEGRPESIQYEASVGTITPEYLEVEESDGKIRRIDLEARTAKVAWVKNMPTTVAGASVNVPGALTAEAKARLAAQGIDPQQIERARQAAMQAAAGRSRAVPGGEAPGTVVTPVGGRTVDVTRGTRVNDGTPNTDGVVPMKDIDATSDTLQPRKHLPTGVDN